MNGPNPPAISAQGEKLVSPQSLAARIEQIGRSANRETAQHVALSAPCVAAARVRNTDGQIADQAYAHSRTKCAALRYAE